MFVVYSHPDIPRLSPTMMGFRTERGQLHSHRCSDIHLRNLSWRPPGGPTGAAGPYCRVTGRASAASDRGSGGRF